MSDSQTPDNKDSFLRSVKRGFGEGLGVLLVIVLAMTAYGLLS